MILGKMTMSSPNVQFKKRLLYLSGALRVSTRPQATVGGSRSHVLGVLKAFEDLHWQVSAFIVGDIIPLSWVTRSFDQKMLSSRGKRIAADLARLLCRYLSGFVAARKSRYSDWVYERMSSFQDLGSRFKKRRCPGSWKPTRSFLKESLKTAFMQKENWPEMGRLARNEIERSCSWTARVRSMIPQIERILQKNESL
jgi:hypothetical protein